jgi:hypothetical protein
VKLYLVDAIRRFCTLPSLILWTTSDEFRPDATDRTSYNPLFSDMVTCTLALAYAETSINDGV